jgi:hypothetical protein
MRRIIATALLSSCSVLPGCSMFGYYRHPKAVRAPPEVGEKIRDPASFVATTELDGPSLAALQVALNEFMPPGAKSSGNDEQLVRCFSRRDTFDVSVQKASDDLYFVSFLADLTRCDFPPDTLVMDAGATYVIDGQGRVLDVR